MISHTAKHVAKIGFRCLKGISLSNNGFERFVFASNNSRMILALFSQILILSHQL